MRRLAVAVAAIVAVVVAEVAATLSATWVRRNGVVGATPVRPGRVSARCGGEPHLSSGSGIPAGARDAAVTFVRDDALWNDGQLAAIPAPDATRRVIRLLEQHPKDNPLPVSRDVDSVRFAAGPVGYVVTSATGNFLVGRTGSRWLVVSPPGD